MAIRAIQGNSFVKGNRERNARKSKFINKNCEKRNETGGKFNRFQKDGKFPSNKEGFPTRNVRF